MEGIWESQPFILRGVDSDNGGEFLNFHLYDWLRVHGIKQTRSRPYYKNDQAYVEQKNYTHARELLDYERLEHLELLDPLNELLKEWSLFKNLFCVTMKQKSKWREGSRQIRRHEKQSHTPAQQLLKSGALNEKNIQRLNKLLAEINPFEMRCRIRKLEDRFWQMRNDLYKQDKEERLALESVPTLRFGTLSKREKKQTKKRIATVS